MANHLSRREMGLAGTAFSVLLSIDSVASTARGADQKGDYAKVQLYQTPRGNELLPGITIAGPSANYQFNSVYTIKVPELQVGDVVQAYAHYEVTNDVFRYKNGKDGNGGFNKLEELRAGVMVGHALFSHSKDERLVGAGYPDKKPGWSFLPPCFYAGENVSYEVHHSTRTLAGFARAAVPGDIWVSLILYADSTAKFDTKPFRGQNLKVEPNCGGLSILVSRG